MEGSEVVIAAITEEEEDITAAAEEEAMGIVSDKFLSKSELIILIFAVLAQVALLLGLLALNEPKIVMFAEGDVIDGGGNNRTMQQQSQRADVYDSLEYWQRFNQKQNNNNNIDNKEQDKKWLKKTTAITAQ